MPVLARAQRDLTAQLALNPICNWISNGSATMVDDSGNGNNATTTATTKLASWDGVHNALLTGPVQSVNNILATTGAFSIECMLLMSGSGIQFFVGVNPTDTYWSVTVGPAANISFTQTEGGVRATQNFSNSWLFADEPFHFALMRNADGKTLTAMVNGVLLGGPVTRANPCNATGVPGAKMQLNSVASQGYIHAAGYAYELSQAQATYLYKKRAGLLW